jgi:hypothetical protein
MAGLAVALDIGLDCGTGVGAGLAIGFGLSGFGVSPRFSFIKNSFKVNNSYVYFIILLAYNKIYLNNRKSQR